METIIAHKDFFQRETVTGTNIEHKIVDKLYKLFKETMDHVEKIPVPVDSWQQEECMITIGDYEIKCYAMPYTLSGEVDARLVYAEYLGDKIILEENPSDSIVLIPFPPDLDDSKYIVLKLYEQGANAVIFYDRLPGRYRKTVIIGDEDYSHTHGSPSPVPVASIRKEDYLKIMKTRNARAYLRMKTSIKHGATGYNVVGIINGKGEKEIHITAHHDHWFAGFSDNLLGVETLLQVAKYFRKKWKGCNLVFISFTAEESGAPYFTSWYWTWGSRYYLKLLEETGKIENILADVNIDTIYREPFTVNYNPSLRRCIEKLSRKYKLRIQGYDHTDFDSFSYTMHGVPALTINNLKEITHIYHTDLDDGREVPETTIRSVLELVIDTITCINNNPPTHKSYVEYLKQKFEKYTNAELRALIGKIENLETIIHDEQSRIRITTVLLTNVVYIPGLDGVFLSDACADIEFIHNLLTNVEKYIGKRLRVKIVDREQFLDISPTQHNIEELKIALRNALLQRIQYHNKRINQFISEILIKQTLKK